MGRWRGVAATIARDMGRQEGDIVLQQLEVERLLGFCYQASLGLDIWALLVECILQQAGRDALPCCLPGLSFPHSSC